MRDFDIVKVLVVDDSITFRQILNRVVSEIPSAECVGVAASGQIALRKAETLQPDLVLLDVMMPEMDGVETLKHLKSSMPFIEAIMISGFNMDNAKATMRSLALGALDFVPKPVAANMQEGMDVLKGQLERLIQVVQTKKIARLSRERLERTKLDFPSSPAPASRPEPAVIKPPVNHISVARSLSDRVQLVVIGSSTGGPNALHQVFSKITSPLPCPILIVQHMPPMFTLSLAERLDKAGQTRVKEAENNESIKPGWAYIVPGGKHMVLEKNSSGNYLLVENNQPPVNNCKPSVDVLFMSVAKVFERRVLSVVMTGMGRDGSEGVRQLKPRGTISLIQDAATSVVWGMPGSVFDLGLADEVLSAEDLGPRIQELASYQV
ncbi:MAG: chemotaxis response regulator protein-glutamate methylesterase [SAR324 cluster bacterium]|nr:chemotaxis response regulator protein-glutamate methylesterase [SAR324 cluster bacterium]